MRLLLLILLSALETRGEARWGIMSTFPLPMLVMHNAQFILQNWTADFEQTLRELRTAIIQVNSTRLDLSFTDGLSTWISSVFSYFKEWVGVGLFAVAFCFGLLFLFWMVCKLKTQSQRDKAVIAQAFAALEQGASPDIWLSMLKQ